MDITLYSYDNIVRILSQDSDVFANSVMVDVNLDEGTNLSFFYAEKKFDADFIQSYLNILNQSTIGFRLLTDSRADDNLRKKAVEIISRSITLSTQTRIYEQQRRFWIDQSPIGP